MSQVEVQERGEGEEGQNGMLEELRKVWYALDVKSGRGGYKTWLETKQILRHED